MTDDLPAIVPIRKTGAEPFTSGGEALSFDVKSFWQWAVSDLVSNTARGILAEYIVARALGCGASDVRPEWAAYDLTTPGPDGIKVEVKSAAYIQSWKQAKHSTITYSVAKKRGWTPEDGLAAEPMRHAQVYVLALLAHKDQATLAPLNLDQWRFYVVPTRQLDERERSQHSITLPSLERLGVRPVGYGELAAAVRAAAGR